jgi:hypothetical protein
MLTFRLKWLFFSLLLIGVALIWGKWYYHSSTELTANRLLTAREMSNNLPTHLDEASGEDVLDYLGLAGQYAHGIDLDPAVYFEPDWDEQMISATVNSVEGGTVVKWEADWSIIESKADEEDWLFNRQLIMTIAAALFGGYLVFPKRSRP